MIWTFCTIFALKFLCLQYLKWRCGFLYFLSWFYRLRCLGKQLDRTYMYFHLSQCEPDRKATKVGLNCFASSKVTQLRYLILLVALFDFFPLCIFKWVLELSARECKPDSEAACFKGRTKLFCIMRSLFFFYCICICICIFICICTRIHIFSNVSQTARRVVSKAGLNSFASSKSCKAEDISPL